MLPKALSRSTVVAVAVLVAVILGGVTLLRIFRTPDLRSVPIPFAAQDGSGLAGSLVKIGTRNSIDIFLVEYPNGTDVERLFPDRINLVSVPNDSAITPVSMDAALTMVGLTGVNYFGYEYTTANASAEIAHQNDPVFKDRFPGQFFASAKARSVDGATLTSFETANNVVFTKTDSTAGAAQLKKNTLYVIIVNEPSGANLRVRFGCGDGAKVAPEQCDDGDKNSEDGCSATCQVETGFSCTGDSFSICTANPACGDGTRDTGEACDDANTEADDGCSATCTVETGFTCNTHEPNVCTLICGNGVRNGAETCDDGNSDSGDGCSATCAVETNFTCDAETPNVCTATTVCGNGQLEEDEACDDGDTNSDDGCSATCEVEIGFSCTTDSPSVCTANPECGDGTRDANEFCDDGNNEATDGCSPTCIVETGFSCNTNEPNVCTLNCSNGILNEGEACDDENTESGDGCSGSCSVESGFTCSVEAPSICLANPFCGDGEVDTGETCDDGNVENGDGCTQICSTESGFTCTGSPSQCVAACFDNDEFNIANASTVTLFGSSQVPDRCDSNPLAEELVHEQSCFNNNVRDNVEVCPVGTTCNQGACVQGGPAPSGNELNCTDSDGGFVIGVAGSATNGANSDSDTCFTVNGVTRLQETYCARKSGSVLHLSLRCPNGTVCSNGACVTQ